MNTKQLQTWLGLPAGPWPPDDRTLLGLKPGPVDPLAAETRALALMDRLRPYQLVQPDLVTEGMNRLAQAMIGVTAAPPPEVFSIEPEGPARHAGIAPPPPRPDPEAPAAGPEIVEAEVVEAEVVGPAPAVGPAAPPPRRPAAPVPALFVVPPPYPTLTAPPSDRRAAYRELAALRGLRKAWRGLRASVADPAEPLAGPAEVCGYLEAVAEVRAAVARLGRGDDLFGPAGRDVRAVGRHPASLAVFRSLTAAQRQALARDWAVGLAAIETRTGVVRRYVSATRPGASAGRRTRAAGRWLGRNPEWVLAAATAAVLLAAAG